MPELRPSVLAIARKAIALVLSALALPLAVLGLPLPVLACALVLPAHALPLVVLDLPLPVVAPPLSAKLRLVQLLQAVPLKELASNYLEPLLVKKQFVDLRKAVRQVKELMLCLALELDFGA